MRELRTDDKISDTRQTPTSPLADGMWTLAETAMIDRHRTSAGLELNRLWLKWLEGGSTAPQPGGRERECHVRGQFRPILPSHCRSALLVLRRPRPSPSWWSFGASELLERR